MGDSQRGNVAVHPSRTAVSFGMPTGLGAENVKNEMETNYSKLEHEQRLNNQLRRSALWRM